jgi:excisionase family DNA binding protein
MTGQTLGERLRQISGAITASTLAELLGVSPITVYKRAAKGGIPNFRIGTAVRFDPTVVARWLDNQTEVAR